MHSSKKLLHLLARDVLCLLLCLQCGVCAEPDSNRTTTTSTTYEFPTTSDEVGGFVSDMWSEGTDMAKILWMECSKTIFEKDSKRSPDVLVTALQCVKKKTLKALDRSLGADVISLAPGVELVKYQQIDKRGKLIKPEYERRYLNKGNDTENIDSEWKYSVLEKMMKVFNTHVLKIDIAQEERSGVVEPRHRRRNQMMQMMMFGILSMGMILVPMGFQFLAVLGGKALLLAKFALILSSIQALKKAASGSVNYQYPPLPPVHPESTFEKRGYDLPTSDSDHTKSELEGTQNISGADMTNTGSIAYRFDRENKVWKPQTNSKLIIKKSDTDIGQDVEKVYPVYSSSQTSAINNLNEMRPVYSGFQPFMDSNVIGDNYKVQPTEIHAEYTIDLPIDKVQLKTTSPFITSATQ